MWNYSDKVKDHFFHPRNAKVLEDANGVGDVGSISCGDALRLMIKVDPKTNIITDAGFQTFGCGSAIASSSALTEMIKGKTVDEALKITNKDIADYLDGLPPQKMHCSVMGREALHAAVANYRGESWEESHEESPLICKCFGVDEAKIVQNIRANSLKTVEDVTNYTKAGGACGGCREKIEKILDKFWKGGYEGRYVEDFVSRDRFEKAQAKNGKVSLSDHYVQHRDHPYWDKVEKVLDEMRPGLEQDGGNVELIDVADDKILIRLYGACLGCFMSEMTLSYVQAQVDKALGKHVPLELVEPDLNGTGEAN